MWKAWTVSSGNTRGSANLKYKIVFRVITSLNGE